MLILISSVGIGMVIILLIELIKRNINNRKKDNSPEETIKEIETNYDYEISMEIQNSLVSITEKLTKHVIDKYDSDEKRIEELNDELIKLTREELLLVVKTNVIGIIQCLYTDDLKEQEALLSKQIPFMLNYINQLKILLHIDNSFLTSIQEDINTISSHPNIDLLCKLSFPITR